MLISQLFENDREHHSVMQQTGFWGNKGSGCIFFAQDTKRFLIAHRSDNPVPYNVQEPGTWGSWGGAIDANENPEEAAIREAEEECGYNGEIHMLPMYVFDAVKNGRIVFKYYNYLAVIPNEFIPRLNWESQGYKWCEFGQWPSPLHFGLRKLFEDSNSYSLMRKLSSIK